VDETSEDIPRHIALDTHISPNIDKRNRLDEAVFSYRAGKDKVLLFWNGKQVMTLKGKHAQKFLSKIADLDGKAAQLVMAKVTGNFKHGNER
jgi:hypothetical protein